MVVSLSYEKPKQNGILTVYHRPAPVKTAVLGHRRRQHEKATIRHHGSKVELRGTNVDVTF